MNHNREEQKIKQLFLELRQQDDSHTPPFAEVMRSASVRPKQLPNLWFRWQVATAMALVVSGVAFLLFRQLVTPQQGIVSSKAEAVYFKTPAQIIVHQQERISSVVAPPPKQTIPERRQPTKQFRTVAHRKPFSHSSEQANLLISNWQSPTDFLLKTPDAEWLKSLPQIGESVVDVKNLFPNNK